MSHTDDTWTAKRRTWYAVLYGLKTLGKWVLMLFGIVCLVAFSILFGLLTLYLGFLIVTNSHN